MTLSEFVNSLDNNTQIKLAVDLIETGLPIWEKYNANNQIEYPDSVVGACHRIDQNLI